MQPPSGGCVLKLIGGLLMRGFVYAAAFGRLCVETSTYEIYDGYTIAAAFGRLCVETVTE